MAKWQCEDCGTVHRRNVRKCRNCGNTVLSRYRGEDVKSEALLERWVRAIKEKLFGRR